MRTCNAVLRSLLLAACSLIPISAPAGPAAELLIYVGTTMVPPMVELSRQFERTEGVTVRIAQGVSDNLYQSARKSRVGDLYLPGEPGYVERYRAEGLLGEHVTVGYNRLGILVPKGNPKGVKGDLAELLRPDLRVMIGAPESSAVGAETRFVLQGAGLLSRVLDKAAFLAPDSRGLSMALRNGEADAVLNWRATAYFPENAPAFELIDLDSGLARPRALQLTLLTLSRNPELARRFMALATSELGRSVFGRYGFLDPPRAPREAPQTGTGRP